MKKLTIEIVRPAKRFGIAVAAQLRKSAKMKDRRTKRLNRQSWRKEMDG